MNGPYNPWGFQPPPYYPPPQQPVVFIPTPPPGARAPKAGKKMKAPKFNEALEIIKGLDQAKKDWEAYLEGSKKKDDKPKDDEKKGIFKKTFTFAETWLMVVVFALPVTLILNRLVKVTISTLGIQ